MTFLWLAVATVLRLDVAASTSEDMSSSAGNDLGDCFVLGQCESDTAWVGGYQVAAVRTFADADATEAKVAIATPDAHLFYFAAGDVSSSTAHMSEDRDLQRYDRPHLTAGTLADGSAAAVIRFDWSQQDYREGNRGHGLEVVWTGRWVKHADVVVCSLAATPACSAPVRVDCPRRGCKATLRTGTLRITTRRSRLIETVAGSNP